MIANPVSHLIVGLEGHPQKVRRRVADRSEINADLLKDHCREHDLYMTPRLNDVLYLHHKGFSRIQAGYNYSRVANRGLHGVM